MVFEDGNVRYKERPPNTTTESAKKSSYYPYAL